MESKTGYCTEQELNKQKTEGIACVKDSSSFAVKNSKLFFMFKKYYLLKLMCLLQQTDLRHAVLCVLPSGFFYLPSTRRGLAIGSTGTFPGGLAADLARCPVFFFIIIIIYFLFFCLPNVPK